jgi:hypothetical protein
MSVWRSARRLSLLMHGNSSSLQIILEKIPVLALFTPYFRHFTTLPRWFLMIEISSFICFQGGARRAAARVALQ